MPKKRVTIEIKPILNINGQPLKAPEYDDKGLLRMEDSGRVDNQGEPIKIPVVKEVDVLDVIDIFIRQFPRTGLSMENITYATRIKEKAIRAREGGNLVLRDSEYKWLQRMFKDDKVGASIFGMNLLRVMDAFGMTDDDEEEE